MSDLGLEWISEWRQRLTALFLLGLTLECEELFSYALVNLVSVSVLLVEVVLHFVLVRIQVFGGVRLDPCHGAFELLVVLGAFVVRVALGGQLL